MKKLLLILLLFSCDDRVKEEREAGVIVTMLRVERIEILDTNSRYVMIPKLSDSHKLLREDTDELDDSLT